MNNDQFDIYQYHDFHDFLKAYYVSLKSLSFTLNTWAKKIGYNSPRVIAMAMKGQRAPSKVLKRKLEEYFSFREDKKHYWDLLCQKAVLQYKGLDISEVDEQIQLANPANLDLRPLDISEFKFISEWYHLTILEFAKIKGFIGDPHWIAKKLKNKVTPAKVNESLKLLTKLGHLKKKNNNMYAVSKSVKTGNTVPSLAIKTHHEQMIERAKESIYSDPIDIRHLSSLTCAISASRVAEAKQTIENFIKDFNTTYAQDFDHDEVYQLNVQLFPHTTIN